MAVVLTAEEALEKAAKLILAGNPVAVPTETVYGLAADATNGEAVARIYDVKGRPRFNPLIAHVSDMAMAEAIGEFDPLSRLLAEKFWPGPLTLVLPLKEGAQIHPLVRAGLDTIALRMPTGFISRLIARVGRPLAAPSANSSAASAARRLPQSMAISVPASRSSSMTARPRSAWNRPSSRPRAGACGCSGRAGLRRVK